MEQRVAEVQFAAADHPVIDQVIFESHIFPDRKSRSRPLQAFPARVAHPLPGKQQPTAWGHIDGAAYLHIPKAVAPLVPEQKGLARWVAPIQWRRHKADSPACGSLLRFASDQKQPVGGQRKG